MNDVNYSDINLVEIEREARKLRAEMVANGISAFFGWVKSLFVSRTNRPHQAA